LPALATPIRHKSLLYTIPLVVIAVMVVVAFTVNRICVFVNTAHTKLHALLGSVGPENHPRIDPSKNAMAKDPDWSDHSIPPAPIESHIPAIMLPFARLNTHAENVCPLPNLGTLLPESTRSFVPSKSKAPFPPLVTHAVDAMLVSVP
jgi:hypothetical protein